MTNYYYNSRNLLTTLVNIVGGTTTTYQYDYDADGLQTYKIEPKGRTDFVYDDLGRIDTITEPDGRVTVYTYDDAGNRETQTIDASGLDVEITYIYNDANRLTGTEETRNGQTTTTVYEYDDNGNQTEITETGPSGTKVSSYEYDNFNQLETALTPDNNTITSVYDALGQRAEKTVDGVSTKYYYDGQNVILEKTGSNEHRNIYGINLLARDDGTSILYYLYNGHADVVKLVNSNGTLINQYDYDIFGNPLTVVEGTPNPYRYAGYYYDGETGYYYLNARYYDPKNARFITEDTYFGEYTDPLSLNLYTYAHNNPIIYYDPTGHWPEWGDRAGDFFRNVLKDIGLAVAKSLASPVSGTFKVLAYAGVKANGDTRMANAVWYGMSNAEDQASSFIENDLVTNKAVYNETVAITDTAQNIAGVTGVVKGSVKFATKVVSKVIAKSVAK